jgi:acyl-CoA thioester hydrolase
VIIQEARVRFLQSLLGEKKSSNFNYILTDLSITYLRQGIYGQTLRVDIAIANLTDKGFDLIYQVSDVKTELELARARTGSMWFDYLQQKVVSIPQDLKERILKIESISV